MAMGSSAVAPSAAAGSWTSTCFWQPPWWLFANSFSERAAAIGGRLARPLGASSSPYCRALLAIPDPGIGGYHLHVVNGPAIIDQSIRRIRQAGVKYHLQPQVVTNLAARFAQAATAQLQPPSR